MAANRITYGDLLQILESEGFRVTRDTGTHVLYEELGHRAAIVLPKCKPTEKATGLNIDLLRHTLVNFGFMSDADFQRWTTDPKRFQVA